MDPLRIFADPFNHYGTPSYTHVLDDLFSVPRAGDAAFSPLSPWDAAQEVIPIPATRSRRKDRNPTRSKPKRKAAEAPHSPTRSIPIRVDGPDAKPKRKAAEAQQQRAEPVPVASMVPPAVDVDGRRALSAEAAAVRVQAAARGFLARRAVQAVRGVEKEADDVGCVLRQRKEELRGDRSARVAAGEVLMRMLLRLDAVRGARDYRRKVTRRVLALQDFVDAHEPKAVAGDEIAEEESAVKPRDAVDGIEIKAAAQVMATEPEVVVAEETEDAATTEETVVVEIAEEAEQDDGIQVKAAAETEVEVDVDGGSADGETDAAVETKPASEKPADGSDAEWEIVTEEPAAAPAAAACLEAPCQEPTGQEVTSAADAGAGIVDMGKMMEMLTALCERNEQQYALIGALVERVDALERTVRRTQAME